MTTINIDKVARLAQKKVAMEKASTRIEPNDDDIPQALNWQIIVEPLKPRETSGIGDSKIVLHSDVQEAEHWQINAGRVVALGDQALYGKTASGLDLSKDRERVKIGTFVIWQRYTGLRIKVRQDSGDDRLFLALSGEELVAVPKDPNRLRFWV